MAHNQEMLEHHGARWGDKVRIIGISIDETAEAVVKHVKAKGWSKVEHYHKAGSSCDDDYGVQGVPHVVLIDAEGKIAYVGHPASLDLEKAIEKLLKGEKLAGAGGDDEEEGEAGGYKEVDIPAILTEMASFESKLEELKSNKTLGKLSLSRDFLVLIRETKYDPVTEKFLTNYRNINVLVGKSDQIDLAKSEIEQFLGTFGGSFKSEWRVQKQ